MEEFYSEFYVEATHYSEQGRQGISDRLYSINEKKSLRCQYTLILTVLEIELARNSVEEFYSGLYVSAST